MMAACIISVREYRKEDVLLVKIDSLTATDKNDFFVPDGNPLSTEIPPIKAVADGPQMRTLQISKGDTLNSLLTSESGASRETVEQIISAIRSKIKIGKLKIGQTIVVTYQSATETEPFQLINVEFNVNDQSVLTVARAEDGTYQARLDSLELRPVLRRIDGHINSSFYSTALKLGIPKKIAQDAISGLSYVINFQHGIKNGDAFQILFDEHVDKNGNVVKTGNLRYVALMAGKTCHRIYRFSNNGHVSYYDDQGRSIATGLLQTPLDARKMRITSGFGMRLHPIKGYNKYHKGVDLAAATGTAIKAAGDGVIVRLGYYGEYGNFIKIRHANGYETAYAHMSKYASKLSVGSRVSQNQVIGYVGTTGSSTGPHLHFEVLHKGKNINPMGVRKTQSVQLVGKDLEKFKNTRREIDTHLVSAPSANTIAFLTNTETTQPQTIVG